MNCFECTEQPPPAGMTFADRAAVGVCLRCGRGLCHDHGSYHAAANAFLCGTCAPSAQPREAPFATPAQAGKH
jgi:hypothetical protein